MNTLKLASGTQMPLIGFGLWKVPKESCADVVYNAIKAGYRLFDGASDYGNEQEAGHGVTRAIQDGLVRREELFIVSKLWNTFHEASQVEQVARKQLADWNVDYFDLYYMHFPIALEYVDPVVRYPPGWFFDGTSNLRPSTASIQETWQAMEKLVEHGLAKELGIANFSGSLVMDLLRYAQIRPAVLQIEHHPYLTQTQLIQFAQAEQITVTAFSSFGPQSYLPLNNFKTKSVTSLLEHPTILTVAEKHAQAPSQVLLRWATQRGVATIPKSTNPDRMTLNLQSNFFDLDKEDIRTISALNIGLRFNDPMDFVSTFPIFA
ncbi:NADP-dependent oxidoreductase domain-containing protein [Penicillium canescens]|uniref:D-xylose reductase [NAD(P)H] n=1 Tax=Penicillium canescens TaxID=5083 RepID=A0AAD6N4Z4_PENCN|nr:NADP-dependent oxidoreductase domain-containing protein [Penicillium canescens]KAJ6029950.1 NADP-dependent oxidoreductase domain-containing protein [Penicillium canescens]KAJ6060328.1 NADP-dependent oxidoreductase domain-containing protein [Penicillium canescens]KAJ6078051.1 NADP-dependent oxidoreductase domain-containing protein [Penicillium canescens]